MAIDARARAHRLYHALVTAPVDPASLAAFRILFGLTMTAAMIRFIALGWVDEFYVRPAFHFTWDGFAWVQPLPGPLMHLLFVVLALLACATAIGLHYQTCIALFFVGFTYIELLDKTTYLNHYYLVSLVSGLLILVPAHCRWSLDALRRPALAAPRVPAWTVNVLRFQIAIVYLFAGLAKINADWLLEAQPLRIWLAARSDVAVIGPLFTHLWVAYAFSWFGAAYDLTIVFFLLKRRTRLPAYLTVIVFHAMTAVLFPIGMFPWIMIATTPILFPTNWPRAWFAEQPVGAPPIASGVLSRGLAACLAAYIAIQILVPLRAYRPGGDPDWTYRGFNFAWRVMLVEKAGYTQLTAYDRSTGKSSIVRLRDYVTERQEKMMAQDPYMVRALARHVAATLQPHTRGQVEVRADSFATLNGRPAQRLIDPHVNLAGPLPPNWILPLQRASTVTPEFAQR